MALVKEDLIESLYNQAELSNGKWDALKILSFEDV
jgi:hypothetical protein